jgi:hypothetical protein
MWRESVFRKFRENKVKYNYSLIKQMNQAIIKYYFDLTRYNFAFSVFIGLLTLRPYIGIVTFGTFGMLAGLICYRYFHQNQYYFYYNLGIGKTKLVSFSWLVNIIFMIIFLLIFR